MFENRPKRSDTTFELMDKARKQGKPFKDWNEAQAWKHRRFPSKGNVRVNNDSLFKKGMKFIKTPLGKTIPWIGAIGTGYALNEMMDWGEINDMRTAQKDPNRVDYLDRINRWWEFKNRQPGPPTTLHHDDSTIESFGDIWRGY